MNGYKKTAVYWADRIGPNTDTKQKIGHALNVSASIKTEYSPVMDGINGIEDPIFHHSLFGGFDMIRAAMVSTASILAVLGTSTASAATIVWDNAAPTTAQNIINDETALISGITNAWNITGRGTEASYTTAGGAVFQSLNSKDGPLGVTSGSLTLTQSAAGDGRPADYWNGTTTDAGFEDIIESWGGSAWNQPTATLTLSGLAENTSYRIQFLYSANNNGSTSSGTSIDIDGSAIDAYVLANPTGTGLGQFVTGTLTTGGGETTSVITIGDKGELSAIAIAPIPEPGSLALLGLGGLMVARRRRG